MGDFHRVNMKFRTLVLFLLIIAGFVLYPDITLRVLVLLIEVVVAIETIRLLLIRLKNQRFSSYIIKMDYLAVGINDPDEFQFEREVSFLRSHLFVWAGLLTILVSSSLLLFGQELDVAIFDAYLTVSYFFALGFAGFLLLIFVLMAFWQFILFIFVRSGTNEEYQGSCKEVQDKLPRIGSRYKSIIAPFWKLLKITFIALIFVPVMVLHQGMLSAEQIELFGMDTYFFLLFPNEILHDLGYSLSAGILANAQVLLGIIVLGFVLAIIANSALDQEFKLQEYRKTGWITPMVEYSKEIEKVERTILLLHGYASDLENWTSPDESVKDNQQLITDHFVSELYRHKTRILGMTFTDGIKNGLQHRFKDMESDLVANNYVLELYRVLRFMKERLRIEEVDIVAHSTGGLVFRQLLWEVHYGSLQGQEKHLPQINQVNFLAVPHRGAQGASSTMQFAGSMLLSLPNLLLGFLDGLEELLTGRRRKKPQKVPLKPISRGFRRILDLIGTNLIAFLSDGETALDLNPGSAYLKRLNTRNKKEFIEMSAGIVWYNVSGLYDMVAGRGSQLCNRDCINNTESEVHVAHLAVDHASMVWENMAESSLNVDIPAINKSKKVWEKIYPLDN